MPPSTVVILVKEKSYTGFGPKISSLFKIGLAG